MTTTTTEAAAYMADIPKPHRCPWLMQYLLISPLRRILEPPKKLLAPLVKPGMTVLEPGCGMGFFSLPLAELVGSEGRVLCIDVEPRAVERLARRARRARLDDRIIAQACGPRSLGLDEHQGQVDLVVVIHTMHELEDLPGFLDQVHALLAPGGRMLVVEPRGHVQPAQFEAMLACCEDHGLRVIDKPDKGKRPTALLSKA